MAELLDSGTTREYETGAHRDASEGKGRCDLIPLMEAAYFTEDKVIYKIADFLEKKEEKLLIEAMREAVKTVKNFEESQWTFLLEASHQYEDGAKKYGENNWKRGMPLNVYIDSALRHYFKTMRGDEDEPHWRGFAWNILGALWTVRNTENAWDCFLDEKKETKVEEVEKEINSQDFLVS